MEYGEGAQERYRNLVQSTHDLIQSVDITGKIVFVNSAWVNTFGWNETEALDIMLWDIIHPDSQKHCAAVFEALMNEGGRVNVDAIFVTRVGRKVAVEGVATTTLLNGESVTHAFLRDVTERRIAEVDHQRLQAELPF